MGNTITETRSILIIDDEHLIREILREALESVGFSVVTAPNGKDGLAQMNHPPALSLILLDLMMPTMGGREFLDFILNHKLLSLVPVVVISAMADATNSLGAKAFLRKPVDLDKILNLVSLHALPV
jgi:CheY-like chemotaxis protein